MVDPIVDLELRQAIEGLYVAFAGYPLRDWTEPCLDCCATVESEWALHAVPLRELAAETIGECGLYAMTTWGDEREFKHLLPRLLEVLVTTGFPSPWMIDVEPVFGAFTAAGWLSWPAAERAAVERFFLATWVAVLSTEETLKQIAVNGAFGVLTGIALAVDDLTPYLTRLAADRAPSADHHFLDMGYYVFSTDCGAIGSQDWWSDRPRQLEQLLSWYRSDAQRARGVALLDDPDPDISEQAAHYLAALTGQQT